MSGQTQLIEHLGGEIITRIALADGTVLNVRSPGHAGLHRAETVQIGVSGALSYLFTEDGNAVAGAARGALESRARESAF
jgi:hypothetical protein